MLGLPLGLLTGTLACTGGANKQLPPSVLLVTIDTTRADVLGCYGGKPDTSPQLDAFAHEAVRFERAWTVAPLTLPAHASMLTGLVPSRHGVRDNGRNPLPPQAHTVAEIAAAGGVQTAAVLSAAVLNKGFGLAQGFETYLAPGDVGGDVDTHFPSQSAGKTLEQVEDWLSSSDPGKGIFMWVHLWEPHAPYQPPAEFQRSNPYLGEVAAADRAFGVLLDLFDQHGRTDSTTVIVTADHGEAFGEHGERTHGALCFNTTMQVPLMVRAPGQSPSVDRRIASVVDVAPTILAALGMETPQAVDGADLLAADPHKGAYLESMQGWYAYGWSPVRGWVNEDGKYWRGGKERMFDLADTKQKLTDLEPWRQALRQLDELPTLAATGNVDSTLQAQVEALGYAMVAGEAEQIDYSPGQMLDPADRGAEMALINRITSLGNKGNYEEAIKSCRELLGDNRDNIWAQDMLGACLLATNLPQQAIAPLQQVVQRNRASARTYANLAIALHQLGRDQEAIPNIRASLRLNPDKQVMLQLAKELGIK